MIWNIDPVFLHLGPLEIRYYGVFFAIGLLLGASAFPIYFEQRHLGRKNGESLTLWTPIAMIIGAHLIHLIFYEPEVFTGFFEHQERSLRRIVEIGSGLASHGGGLGAILAVVIYAKRKGVDPWRYLDAAMCGACWVFPWVRIGNFFNSEIVGRVSDVSWAIVFPRYECTHGGYVPYTVNFMERCAAVTADFADLPARHPSQLYEAVLGFLLIGVAVYIQKNWRDKLRPGAAFMILLGLYFTWRFFVEYLKAYQVLDADELLTRGQQLSLPIVAFCLWGLFLSKKHHIRTALSAEEHVQLYPPVDLSEADGAEVASDSGREAAKPPKKKKKKKKK